MAQRQFRSDDTSTWAEKYGNGSDGAYAPSTGTDAPIDSACTGTSGATSLTATNASFAAGQLILIHQTQGTGAGQWELNKISSYSAGTITTSYALTNTYASGAQVLVMPQYSSGSIGGGVTITGKAWNGTVGGIFAKLVNGTFNGTGTINISGGDGAVANDNAAGGTSGGFRGGQGEASGTQAWSGESATGTSLQQSSANGMGGGGGDGPGGGGGNQGAAGGGGGYANAGTAGEVAGGGGTAGAGGGTGGSASLVTMVFGGAGGGGGNNVDEANGVGGGGAGGGIIFIIAKTIDLSGMTIVKADGGNGGNGFRVGGKGAGGSILLKGQTITLGTGKVTAITPTTSGTASSDGRIHADYLSSVTGTTSPTIDSRLDTSLADVGGSFLLNML